MKTLDIIEKKLDESKEEVRESNETSEDANKILAFKELYENLDDLTKTVGKLNSEN